MISEKLKIPLIQGGMGIGVSLGRLAGSVAKEGAMGVISTANPGYMKDNFWSNPKEANRTALIEQIKKAKDLSQGKGMIAVNVMVAGCDYETQVKTALENGIDAIISGAGLPLHLPEIAKGYKTLLAPIVSSGRAASTICRAWQKKHNRLPDFIVLEGSMAGGHLGFSLEELNNKTAKPLMELLKEVKEVVTTFGSIPIFVAGGIFSSKQVLEFIKNGAEGVQIATRFIATEECDASEGYKDTILNAKEESVIIQSPVGMPGRALRTPLVERVEREGRIAPKICSNCLLPCNPAQTPYCITKALIDAVKGDYENGLFFCSENITKINKRTTVKELIDELMFDWRNQ
ncbi:MAG: nitronate monooxygenase family protein [Oscillospiraceae bacterium]